MKSPCEVVSKYILPVFRAMVAKELMKEYGYSQAQVASKLGISQAAVSYYVNSKRGVMMVSELEKIPNISKTLTDVVKTLTLTAADDSDELSLAFCRLCSIIRNSETFWENLNTYKKITLSPKNKSPSISSSDLPKSADRPSTHCV
jgi:hypothetical protein